MATPKCKTCMNYEVDKTVEMEGVCNDPTKFIFVTAKRINEKIKVFDFSWCTNHKNGS